MSTPENWKATVQKKFGFAELRPGQESVIQKLLDGKNAAAIFPTGGGKSLCFQAPAIMLPGITLVVSPLLALMKDQIDALLRRGIPAARLDSSLTFDEYRNVCDQARDGTIKLLYVAPERFSNERFQTLVADLPLSLMAIDEAHCISQWGHNFRPDYLKLSQYASDLGVERVLALTATAAPQVAVDMCTHLNIDDSDVVRTPFFRRNLALKLSPVSSAAERNELLLSKLSQRAKGPTIVYVTLQKTAMTVAADLQRAGHEAKHYHAGMKSDERESVQEWFMESSDRIVVATIAFGMGIDKADIRYVYHFNPPKSLESYAQEIGRAGRDGGDSICETFYLPEDRHVLENFAYGDTPSKEALASLLEFLFSHDDTFEVSHYALSRDHDVRTLVLRTLLVYLELEGYFKIGTAIYTSSRFKPKLSSAEILANFDEERQKFLKEVLACATKGRTWFSLDIDKAAKKTGSDRRRVARALDYLADKGWLELEPSGVVIPYQIQKRPESIEALIDEMWLRMQERESGEIHRINEFEQLVLADKCQALVLSEHFGEQIDADCGTCSRCEGEAVANLSSTEPPPIDDHAWSEALELREKNESIRPSRAFVRWLMGVSSPAISRSPLRKHELYGKFEDVPFGVLLARAEESA